VGVHPDSCGGIDNLPPLCQFRLVNSVYETRRVLLAEKKLLFVAASKSKKKSQLKYFVLHFPL
jgi:hypothetical protein